MTTIDADISPQTAADAVASLLAVIEGHNHGPLAIELSETAPTQISIQLAFAALRELRVRGIEAQPGKGLAALLEHDVQPKVGEEEAK